MELNLITILLASLCLAGAFVCVIADRKNLRAVAVVAKVIASTCFVLLAFFVGAAETAYGRAIITALLLSWLGDVLLLSQRSPFLLAGIAAFFLAHIGFAFAFGMNKISTPILAVSLTAGVVAGILLLRWLWSYLRGAYRWAVPFYVLAIVVMVSLAAAASASSLPAGVAVGGVAFAVSDVAVARDRFVEHNGFNKAWGLPLYYFAQILFAASAGTGG